MNFSVCSQRTVAKEDKDEQEEDDAEVHEEDVYLEDIIKSYYNYIPSLCMDLR